MVAMSIIPPKIRLTLVPQSDIEAVLGLWDKRLELRPDAIGALPRGNFFRKYLEGNRPGASSPIRAILSSITTRYRVSVLLESPYLDLDFWDNHSRFYSGSFTRYPVWCDRLHFFEGSSEDVTELCRLLLQGCSEIEIHEAGVTAPYIGYCILRPTPAFVVSRTAISLDAREGASIKDRVSLLKEEEEAKPFLKVHYPCVSHLLNARYSVDSVEFIQQDPNLGHCGTAAIWVATKAMAYQFGTNRFQYGAITRQAIGGWNRERDVNIVYDPSNMDSGVSVSEMRNAIAETGANSLTFMPHGESPDAAFARLSHEVYSFLESGIPVLLCLEGEREGDAHVVAIVGHSLPSRIDFSKCLPACQILGADPAAEFNRHYLISSAIRLYYAHDDSYGPFNRVLMVDGVQQNGVQAPESG